MTIRASLGNDFNGSWTDNDTNSGTLEFNPPNCASGCGGPRTIPVNYDRATSIDRAGSRSDLRAEVERLRQAVAALAVRKDD